MFKDYMGKDTNYNQWNKEMHEKLSATSVRFPR